MHFTPNSAATAPRSIPAEAKCEFARRVGAIEGRTGAEFSALRFPIPEMQAACEQAYDAERCAQVAA